jgi:hypothetical protein
LKRFEGIGVEEPLVDSFKHVRSGCSKAVTKGLVVCT